MQIFSNPDGSLIKPDKGEGKQEFVRGEKWLNRLAVYEWMWLGGNFKKKPLMKLSSKWKMNFDVAEEVEDEDAAKDGAEVEVEADDEDELEDAFAAISKSVLSSLY